jgi:hypothetical protein
MTPTVVDRLINLKTNLPFGDYHYQPSVYDYTSGNSAKMLHDGVVVHDDGNKSSDATLRNDRIFVSSGADKADFLSGIGVEDDALWPLTSAE